MPKCRVAKKEHAWIPHDSYGAAETHLDHLEHFNPSTDYWIERHTAGEWTKCAEEYQVGDTAMLGEDDPKFFTRQQAMDYIAEREQQKGFDTPWGIWKEPLDQCNCVALRFDGEWFTP